MGISVKKAECIQFKDIAVLEHLQRIGNHTVNSETKPNLVSAQKKGHSMELTSKVQSPFITII